MGTDLVEAAGFGGSLHQADLPVFRVGAGAQGFKFGDCGVGAGNDGLPDINSTGLVFTQAVQGLIDHPFIGWAAMDNSQIGFMNLPPLLHFA